MSALSSETPFHPAYGLADETRVSILRDAEVCGVKAAAEKHRVHPSVVYQWRKRYSAAPAQPVGVV
jgi:transposase-like protein